MLNPESILEQLLKSALAAVTPTGKFTNLPSKPPVGNSIVLAAGKAGASMAVEFEKVWKHPCTGLAVVPYGHQAKTEHVDVMQAAHPVPDEQSQLAAKKFLKIAHSATKDDYVFYLGSGGSSALLAAPAPGLSLEKKQNISKQLLAGGAVIDEFNTVRRSLSAIKGGRLAQACYPAQVFSYLISDIPNDDPAVIGSGPTIPQTSSTEDVFAILDKYKVDVDEQTKQVIQDNAVDNLEVNTGDVRIIIKPVDAIAAASDKAKELDLEVNELGTQIEGDAHVIAKQMAQLAIKTQSSTSNPVVILSGGELSVAVKGKGKGGRNLEFLLALAVELEGAEKIYALAVDTDGCDGNSNVAGAIVTPDTLLRAIDQGIDPKQCLEQNDAFKVFDTIHDSIDTGPTLTNVNDFRAILILPK